MREREREDAQRGSPLIDDEPTTAPARSSELDRSNAVVFQSFGRSHTIPLAFASRSLVCSLAICIAKKTLSASRFSCTQNTHNYFCQELIATLTTSTYY